jgi:carboxyl-terminal processing protease
LQHVRRDYVEPVKDNTVLTYGAIRGMLASLEDPYTRFLEPEAYRQFSTETRGEFGGIGAVLGVTKDEEGKREIPVVADIIKGGPAERAGLKVGDIVLRVDTQSTAGQSLEDSVRLIRGPKGTKVSLTIARKGVEEPLQVTIVREIVEVPVVEHKMLKENMGYLAIKQFNEHTVGRMDEALADLERQGMKGLIIDLRNNPGGLLNTVIEAASTFIKNGPIVFTKERGKDAEPKMADPARYWGYGMPIVVLVNHMSASGSEILAAAVQQDNVGKLVGTQTYGKGLVQTAFPLTDGSAVLITTAKYLTPDGEDINKKGVKPDEVVESGTGESTRLMTPQELEQAVDRLQALAEGKSEGREEASRDLGRIRRALGLTTEPAQNQPDKQLEAAERLVSQEMTTHATAPVAAQ